MASSDAVNQSSNTPKTKNAVIPAQAGIQYGWAERVCSNR
jgi:hypothetical protein